VPLQPIMFGYTANPNRNDNQGYPVNCYPEDTGQENEGRWIHYACAGYTAFATTGAGLLRGYLRFDDTKYYVVYGNTVYKVTSAGVSTAIGSIAGTGWVYMARNRKEPNAQVALVTAGIYQLIENDIMTTPAIDVDVGVSEFVGVTHLDGYFAFPKSNAEWFISEIDDGNTIDDLKFALANAKPDGLSFAITRGDDLFMMGPQSIQVYQDTGQTDFPFEPVTTIGIGIAYPKACVNITAVLDGGTSDVLIFPANNPDATYLGVVLMDGYNAKTISPLALDRAIKAEPDKTSIVAFSITEQGHTFYVIRGSTFCWSMDTSTNFWHKRENSAGSPWPIGGGLSVNGQQILCNVSGGANYLLDITPQAPASASTVSLRHSNDNGTTWIGPRTKPVGTAKTVRVRWIGLGQSREDGKVFEFTFSNALVENGTGVSAKILTPPVNTFPSRMIFNALYCNITSGVSQTTQHKGFTNLAVDAEGGTP
jgi:hypothetical protein